MKYNDFEESNFITIGEAAKSVLERLLLKRLEKANDNDVEQFEASGF